MSTTEFENILALIAPRISRVDTRMRKAVPAHERLAFTLRFSETGDLYHSLQYNFKISRFPLTHRGVYFCSCMYLGDSPTNSDILYTFELM